MSNGPREPHTYVELREYVDVRIRELTRYYDSQLDTLRLATDKAERQLSTRLEGMNEIRDAMKDQASLFVTRGELELRVKSLEKDVHGLELSRARILAISSTVAFLVSAVVALVGSLLV
jgi:hypothetical protein